MLQRSSDLVARFGEEQDFGKALGLGARHLVRQAATIEAEGQRKEDEVVTALVALLFARYSEADLKEKLDDLLAFSGLLEVATDAGLKLLPIQQITEKLVRLIVRSSYAVLREEGSV